MFIWSQHDGGSKHLDNRLYKSPNVVKIKNSEGVDFHLVKSIVLDGMVGVGEWGGCLRVFKDCLWESKTLSRTRIGSLAFSKMKEPIQNRDKKMGQI